MSGFGKNIIPRRSHKERSQPAVRLNKHGLLEKKRDYKLRAADRNRKKLRVKLLREKAAFRNPNEFYFAMNRSGTDRGRVIKTINTTEKDAVPIHNRPRDERLLAETQDSRYVALKLSTEAAGVRKLADNLHFLEQAEQTPRTHVFFADDEEEAQGLRAQRRSRSKSTNLSANESTSKEHETQPNNIPSKAYEELEKRSERVNRLRNVLNDMSRDKLTLAKGARILVKPSDRETGAPPIFRWRKERSR